MAFAKELRYYRERAGKSQADLGRSCGFDHSFISRLESGERKPSRPAVDRIVAALELSPDASSLLLSSAGFLPSTPAEFIKWPVIKTLTRLLEAEYEPSLPPGPLETLLIGIADLAERPASV